MKFNKGDAEEFIRKLDNYIYLVNTETLHPDVLENLLSKLHLSCADAFEGGESYWHVLHKLRGIIKQSRNDAQAIYNNDPAASSIEEVIICYPGYKAIVLYRIAHEFYKDGYMLIARYISEYAHSITGIDIHPGAEIEESFAIDHGTGIVIGETTQIGKNVIIYQGVTLGAIHLENRDQVGQKRHPTIKDNVVIYANATILGGETVIDYGVTIKANSFITKSVITQQQINYN